MKLARFPRVRLTHAPTPLEPMPNLTRALGGPKLWIKRDDCTGLASGGNKTRKLEYLMGEALAQKADVVITQGATQSNHARQTAAAGGQARSGVRDPARGPHRLHAAGLSALGQRTCSIACSEERCITFPAGLTWTPRWPAGPMNCAHSGSDLT